MTMIIIMIIMTIIIIMVIILVTIMIMITIKQTPIEVQTLSRATLLKILEDFGSSSSSPDKYEVNTIIYYS